MRAALALAALSCAAAPGLACAADKMSQNDQARVIMRDYGTCIISRGGNAGVRGVEKFLAVSPMSPAGEATGRQLATPDCLRSRDPDFNISQLRMQPQLMRGVIYRAKFRRAFLGKPLGPFAPFDAKAAWHMPPTDNYAQLQAVGECVVRADPVDTRAIVDSEVASPAENQAFAAIIPHLQGCTPQTGQYRFSRAVLESIFAEALYNLAIASVPAASAKGDAK